jgi:hypothetical protein
MRAAVRSSHGRMGGSLRAGTSWTEVWRAYKRTLVYGISLGWAVICGGEPWKSSGPNMAYRIFHLCAGLRRALYSPSYISPVILIDIAPRRASQFHTLVRVS